MKKLLLSAISCSIFIYTACNNEHKDQQSEVTDTLKPNGQVDSLPPPYQTKSVSNGSKVIDWPADKMPVAPAGFKVEKYAANLQHPRWIYVAPDGNIFVAESDANQITLLRDNNKDGKPETRAVYLKGLNKPFGMLVIGNTFYLANTDGLWAYPYQANQTKIIAAGKKILDLPAGGYNNHWTRNIIANDAGTKIYVSVGSGSNAGENGMDNEKRRANILEINTDGSGEKVYGYGIRNPVGMGWAPGTNTLWTAVNERDELGDELVPDYLTSVKEGGFYGWPYSYFGQHKDPRLKDARPDLVANAIVPDVALGAHSASLGLAFYNGNAFPEKYHNGAFVGQHGSWNRSKLAGYKVIFVPFANGMPNGKPEDFLTGFIANANVSDVYGRPVGVAVAPDGALLVADDGGNIIWRITNK